MGTLAPTPHPVADAERLRLAGRARMLSWVSLVYMSAEGAIAVTAGVLAGSVALVGFGLDSAIEGFASAIIVWRFTGHRVFSEAAERRAQRLVAIQFLVLAPYVGVESLRAIVTRERPDASVVGIALAAAGLAVMPYLGIAKARLADRLGSAATRGEGRQNLLCAYLAGALLLGLVGNMAFGAWWLDPAVGLLIAGVAVREGIEAWRGTAAPASPGRRRVPGAPAGAATTGATAPGERTARHAAHRGGVVDPASYDAGPDVIRCCERSIGVADRSIPVEATPCAPQSARATSMPQTSPATRIAVAAASLLLLLAAVTGAAAAPSIAGTRAEVEQLGRQVAEMDIAIGQAVAAQNAAIDRLEEAQSTLAVTRGELSGARRDLERSRGLLRDRIVSLYVEGTPTFAEVLLTSGSLADAQEATDLIDQIARGDASAVAGVRVRRARLETLEEQQISAEAVRRRELEASEDRRAELDAALASRRAVLDEARAELRRLVKEEKARKARLAALEKARRAALTSMPYAGSTAIPGALPAGDFLFPVAGPTTFTNDWMYPRPGGRSHQGIDLFAARGTPVVAVADGSLFNVGYNGLGGWRLWVRDRAGNGFYYAHLSAYSPAAVEGATVTRGTVLGYVGDSGDARGTPNHLHFEIHPGGGGPVPPYPIVTGWPRAG
ncbi:peptidoglycan DD-metalloendopeptidase family protein [Miltoncostaea oceani]|uniref:peptidoglycan DD-metalloendopeptidase family protein n=1 Tax=Miltoncostaea oceani TaxID=2843216 RepID=UPI001C3D3576|nr:peptidoglycan DD-metalloendopeptidase family protein [Miltoncostaea oceani]